MRNIAKACFVATLLLLTALFIRAQSSAPPPSPQWQIDAGGKMAFEVASVKVNKSGESGFRANIPFTLGPTMSPVGGLFSATNMPMRNLLGFAYKLSLGQVRFLIAGLPNWVDSERFDIEARAEDNPTKDQFRLMLQSLLAERFKLAMHHDTRQLPILAMVLSKPGKIGSQLIPHIDDAKCGSEGRSTPPPAPVQLAELPCGAILTGGLPTSVPGRIKSGGRKLTLDYIAAFLTGTTLPGFHEVDSDRVVVNRTGLSGEFDFWIEFVPSDVVLPQSAQPDPNGSTMLEALQEQLGLKLESQTGAVDVLVVDHVEQPSEN